MTLDELQEEIEKKQKLAQLEALEANKYRAQSITVGTAGGGTAEITMRSSKGMFLWNTYQPVEVIELINQLAAGIGCHIHIQPREDFASWRQWKPISEEERKHLNGFPPFPSLLGKEEMQIGVNLSLAEKELIEEKENVATKKAVNKRSPKRSRSSSK